MLRIFRRFCILVSGKFRIPESNDTGWVINAASYQKGVRHGEDDERLAFATYPDTEAKQMTFQLSAREKPLLGPEGEVYRSRS